MSNYGQIGYFLERLGPLFEKHGYRTLEVDTTMNLQYLPELRIPWTLAFWKDANKSEGVLLTMFRETTEEGCGSGFNDHPRILLRGVNGDLSEKLPVRGSCEIVLNGSRYYCGLTEDTTINRLLQNNF